MELEQKIEAILFYKSEPVSVKKLAGILRVKEGEIQDALKILEESLRSRGVRLVRKDDEVMLGTAPELSGLLEDIVKSELSQDLGRAGLETLAIVIYQGPITRAKIDFVRGVNSSFILRNLAIRGLVDRVSNSADSRSYLYKPSFQLLSHLGVTKVEDLPDYVEVVNNLEYLEHAD